VVCDLVPVPPSSLQSKLQPIIRQEIWIWLMRNITMAVPDYIDILLKKLVIMSDDSDLIAILIHAVI
jgi:hypothetical protein